MKKIIAQCHTNLEDRLGLTHLKKLLPDFDILYGQEVLELIKTKKVNPKNVIVIQECNSKIARKLRKKGALAFINYCWESPIYAYIFYSKLKSIAPKFKHRIYFKGMGFLAKDDCQSYYPGICKKYKQTPIEWKSRKFASFVIGNKYEEQKNVFPNLTYKIDLYLKWFFRLFFETKNQKSMQANELQNKRLELIKYFGEKNALALFGNGWEDLSALPKHWQIKLHDLTQKLSPQPIQNKLDTISKYKFNFAIENMKYEGYVTEKIQEALMAETIPVYLGAPDIYDYFPKDCFIDMRDFANLDELYNYMQNLTEKQAQIYLDNAKKFLNSDDAKKYTIEGFSEIIAKMVKSEGL